MQSASETLRLDPRRLTHVLTMDAELVSYDPDGFIADHPFVFLIRDRLSGAILLCGRVVDPR